MTFNESSTVEKMILDATAQLGSRQASMVRENAAPYSGESLGEELHPARWTYASYDPVPRQVTFLRIVHRQGSTRDRE